MAKDAQGKNINSGKRSVLWHLLIISVISESETAKQLIQCSIKNILLGRSFALAVKRFTVHRKSGRMALDNGSLTLHINGEKNIEKRNWQDRKEGSYYPGLSAWINYHHLSSITIQAWCMLLQKYSLFSSELQLSKGITALGMKLHELNVGLQGTVYWTCNALCHSTLAW